MNFLKKQCDKLSLVISKNVKNKKNSNPEIVSYGLYIFFGDLIKQMILFGLAFYLGIFKYVLTAYLVMALLRSFSGGVHSKTWLGCLITNTSIMLSICYAAIYLNFSQTIFILISGFCIVSFHLYVPADQKNKPIIGIKHRKKLRIISFCMLILILTISLIFFNSIFSNVILISCLVISISILPVTYKITSNKSGNHYIPEC